MIVCFTGPATDAQGNPILRADLLAAAAKAGDTVLPRMDGTATLLVASRIDTAKARQAALRGVEVIDYPTYLKRLQEVPTASQSSHWPDKWVDDPVLQPSPPSGFPGYVEDVL